MFIYDKKLQYPVKIDKPNPRLASIIISQYGGPDGELGASLRYLSQRYSMPFDELKGLLTDIGIEDYFWLFRKSPIHRGRKVAMVYGGSRKETGDTGVLCHKPCPKEQQKKQSLYVAIECYAGYLQGYFAEASAHPAWRIRIAAPQIAPRRLAYVQWLCRGTLQCSERGILPGNLYQGLLLRSIPEKSKAGRRCRQLHPT